MSSRSILVHRNSSPFVDPNFGHGTRAGGTILWYRALHEAGRQTLANKTQIPGFLKREIEEIIPGSIRLTARKLGLADDPAWKLASEHIDRIKDAMRALEETFNYNDFHWTNLALSRRAPVCRAIVSISRIREKHASTRPLWIPVRIRCSRLIRGRRRSQ